MSNNNYLKYKKKYLDLKKIHEQKGGECVSDIPSRIIEKIVPLFNLSPFYNSGTIVMGDVSIGQVTPDDAPSDIGNLIALHMNTKCTYNLVHKYYNKLVVVIDFATIIKQICIFAIETSRYKGEDPNPINLASPAIRNNIYLKFANLLCNIQKDSYIYIIAKPFFGITIKDCMDYYLTHKKSLPGLPDRIGNTIYDNIIIYNTFYYNTTVVGNIDLQFDGGMDSYVFWLLSVCLFNIVKLLGGSIKLLTLNKQFLSENYSEPQTNKTILNDLLPDPALIAPLDINNI